MDKTLLVSSKSNTETITEIIIIIIIENIIQDIEILFNLPQMMIIHIKMTLMMLAMINRYQMLMKAMISIIPKNGMIK